MTLAHADSDLAAKHGAWTFEEDKLLAKYQEIHGNRWSLVAQNIPGRTGQQCAQRWRHKVNPDIRKEKWTHEEDHLLASLVAEHGNRWADIARHMPGRTDQQCMGRWRRHLDPSIRKCQWQDYEDVLLKRQYDALGPQWSNISKFLQGRTAQQCRARWFQLCPQNTAPPVPRSARNHNGRRDRHHDGASIQASARALVAQMTGPDGDGTYESQDMQRVDTMSTGEENALSSVTIDEAIRRRTSVPSPELLSSRQCQMPQSGAAKSGHPGVSKGKLCEGKSATQGSQDKLHALGNGASSDGQMKSRRAAAKRSDELRMQLLSPDKGIGVSTRKGVSSPVKPAWDPEQSQQNHKAEASLHLPSWEGKGLRKHHTRLRKNIVSVAKSSSEEDDCETPKADNWKVLEAAAALTEMAGGSRVNTSCSPPSVRAPNTFLPDSHPAEFCTPKKSAYCTPAKRPAQAPLWEVPNSVKLTRPGGVIDSTPQATPSNLMQTPLLQPLGSSPCFSNSPLPPQSDPFALTPGSRNLLQNMAHDPIDRMEFVADLSPELRLPTTAPRPDAMREDKGQFWNDPDGHRVKCEPITLQSMKDLLCTPVITTPVITPRELETPGARTNWSNNEMHSHVCNALRVSPELRPEDQSPVAQCSLLFASRWGDPGCDARLTDACGQSTVFRVPSSNQMDRTVQRSAAARCVPKAVLLSDGLVDGCPSDLTGPMKSEINPLGSSVLGCLPGERGTVPQTVMPHVQAVAGHHQLAQLSGGDRFNLCATPVSRVCPASLPGTEGSDLELKTNESSRFHKIDCFGGMRDLGVVDVGCRIPEGAGQPGKDLFVTTTHHNGADCKAQVSNSSTGKSSGVSSVDGVEKLGRTEVSGCGPGVARDKDRLVQNVEGMNDVDGVRRELHSIVEDVFAAAL